MPRLEVRRSRPRGRRSPEPGKEEPKGRGLPMRAIAVLFFAALAQPAAAGSNGPAEPQARNKAVATRVFDEIFNQGKFQVAAEIYAPDFKNHGLHRDANLKEDQDAVHAEKKAFPDLKMSVDMLAAEGDSGDGPLDLPRDEHLRRLRRAASDRGQGGGEMESPSGGWSTARSGTSGRPSTRSPPIAKSSQSSSGCSSGDPRLRCRDRPCRARPDLGRPRHPEARARMNHASRQRAAGSIEPSVLIEGPSLLGTDHGGAMSCAGVFSRSRGKPPLPWSRRGPQTLRHNGTSNRKKRQGHLGAKLLGAFFRERQGRSPSSQAAPGGTDGDFGWSPEPGPTGRQGNRRARPSKRTVHLRSGDPELSSPPVRKGWPTSPIGACRILREQRAA